MDKSKSKSKAKSKAKAGDAGALTSGREEQGSRLPYDVIGELGKILARYGQLPTLLALNSVSHAVHEETVGPIYRRTVWNERYKDELYESPGLVNPAGWRHIEYLILTEANYSQFKVHQRMVHLHQHGSMDGYDLRDAFPKLKCLSWYRRKAPIMGEEERELHVEIYQSITFLDLIQQGTPDEWFNDPSRQFYHLEVEPIDLLTSLTLKKGAALLHPPSYYDFGMQQQVLALHHLDPSIDLIIEEEEPTHAIFDTFGVLSSILEAAIGDSRGKGQKLVHGEPVKLTCHPEVLEGFLFNLAQQEPLLLPLHVTLLGGQISKKRMKYYVNMLAETYHRHWIHMNANDTTGTRFVTIESRGTTPDSSGAVPVTIATFDIEPNENPADEQDNDWRGFHCSLATGHIVGRKLQDEFDLVGVHHRCDGAPIDPPFGARRRRPWEDDAEEEE